MTGTELIGFLKEEIARGSGGRLGAQVARAVEQAVRAGFLGPGDALPSERRLCDQLGVSRTTLRRSLALLENAGIVTRKLGSGTFVAPRVMAPKSPLAGFTQDIVDRGMTPRSVVVSRTEGQIHLDESFNLGLAPGTRVLRLERLRAVAEQVFCLEHSVVPVAAVDMSFDPSGSLYAAMEKRGARPCKIVQRYGAAAAKDKEARHLEVPIGAPLLVLHRLGFAADDSAVEFTRSYFRGDRFYISTELDI